MVLHLRPPFGPPPTPWEHWRQWYPGAHLKTVLGVPTLLIQISRGGLPFGRVRWESVKQR